VGKESSVSKPTDLGVGDFAGEVLGAVVPVLVDFWSPTCPRCQQLNPQFETAGVEQGDEVKFVKVSAADCRPLFAEYGVQAAPTLVLFRAGSELTRRDGSVSSDEIIAWLTEHVQSRERS
jgi:thioredoxin 2